MKQEDPQKYLNLISRINISILAVSFLCCSCQSVEKKNKSKPNVVFILVDDLGYHDFSYTGSNFYETPNIDSLAQRSIVFTQGYASSRVCSPSRASIMLGQHTARHGISDWIGARTGEDWRKTKRHDRMLPAEYKQHLNSNDTTLAEAFKQNGYTTFFAGKWHLGDEGNYPEDHGFDINVAGWESGSPKGGYFSPFENPNLEDKVNGENLSLRLAKETVDFIEKHQDTTFFAFLSFYAVHGPIQTQEEKWAKYRNKAEKQGIAENGFVMEKNLPIRLHQDNPVYAGLVENMDTAVGYVLEGLKKLNLDKNTIIVFTSDNGGVASGDNYSTSNSPLRGGKGYQWEGGIREPYFISVPEIEHKSVDFPVTGADFYPTLLDLAGLELHPNQHKDGRSLKPLIAGTSNLSERSLYWHYPHYGNQGGDPSSVILKGNWKLIHYYESNSQELYNLRNDPIESVDLAKNNPDITTKMYTELMNYLNTMNAQFPQPDAEFDPLKRQQYMQKIKEQRMPKLEKQRREMLSKDFQPNKDWWGSYPN
jgi:arylsulfatase A-like enzyme